MENIFEKHIKVLGTDGGLEFIKDFSEQILAVPSPKVQSKEGYKASAEYAVGYSDGWHDFAKKMISTIKKQAEKKKLASTAEKLAERQEQYSVGAHKT